MVTRREFLTQTAAAGLAATTSGPLGQAFAQTRGSEPKTPLKTYRIPHTDLVVSRLAYGTGTLGLDQCNAESIANAARAMRTAYEQGITFFDFADLYGGGRCEVIMGQLFKQLPGLRAKIVMQSKCGLTADGVDLSRAHIVSAVEGSLKRLGTDHLDLLLLHSSSPLVEPAEVARAFDELQRAGKVRYFGVSNHGVAQIELLKKHVRQPLVANQIWLGLAHYAPIDDNSGFGSLVDYCRLHEIQVQAFSPLRGDDIFAKPVLLSPPADAAPEVKRAAQQLAEVAKQHDASPAAIMLAWLLRHPAGIVPIIGSTKPEHVIDNCSADRIDLSLKEWTRLLGAATALRPTKRRTFGFELNAS